MIISHKQLSLDVVLAKEVDGASITKHKTIIDKIIDGTSSMNIGVNNLLDSLVHDDEDLGMKGDENLPLVVYAEKEGHASFRKTLVWKKVGKKLTCCKL